MTDRPKHLFYDSCYYIDVFRGQIDVDLADLPRGPYQKIGHAIVFMELLQGAHNNAEHNLITSLQKGLDLIGPSVKNYLETGDILRQISQHIKLNRKNLFSLQNDILLALAARDHNTYFVTRNKKDFELIGQFCAVKAVYY